MLKNSNQLPLSPADSLASRSVTQDEEAQRETTAISGRRCYESSGLSVHDSSWQRMFTASLLLSKGWFSKLSTLTWKTRVTKLPQRLYFRLLPSVPHIEGIGSGFVPTPDTTGGAPNLNSNKHNGPKSLIEYVQLLPTLTTSDATGKCPPAHHETRGHHLKDVIGGKLNPEWAEWFMGFPDGWTDLEGLETQ